ncbi:hypothetical protein [Rhizobium bangladeshense]|uniref:hypothetical protein n=1 Tax=Rhizobium bangladeshense TaxID=1138189 RepID=UPI001C8346CA|nr:hypothetical protein [Rhizobium bangladeshense]MBX4889817.1 hypothetical protein [Rhizobium bangladeshense]
MNNPSVNRYLKDKVFDHLDHALGRPVNPLAESYRNYFAIGVENKLARDFSASPNWRKTGQRDDMAYFAVTDAGRKALAAHLRQIGDPWQAFSVTYDETTCIIVATSEADAKKRAFSSASEYYTDLTFRQFSRQISVERAAA